MPERLAIGLLLVAAVATVSTLISTSEARAYTAFVSNEKGNSVSVIDTDKMAVVDTIPVGARPRGITISKDRKTIFVCTSDADHIEAIDADTMTVTRTLPSGADPELFAPSPDGKYLSSASCPGAWSFDEGSRWSWVEFHAHSDQGSGVPADRRRHGLGRQGHPVLESHQERDREGSFLLRQEHQGRRGPGVLHLGEGADSLQPVVRSDARACSASRARLAISASRD